MAQRQWRSDDTDPWLEQFGDGSDGTIYSAPANAGCSGTGGGTSLTLDAASSFANGDLVLIHQTRGTGSGNWELNKIASGGGSTSLTMAYDLIHTYTDSGELEAQIVELKQYDDGLTIGSMSTSAWDKNTGGIFGFFCKGTVTISGTVNGEGNGYKGGPSTGGPGQTGAYEGEGTGGDNNTLTRNANGNGGGGINNGASGGGAGGGNGTAGTAGGNGGQSGVGGSTAGSADLITMVFGGAGGGSRTSNSSSAGADGGAIVVIIAKDIVITGSIDIDGANSSTSNEASGGAGAGGSCLLKCETATLGSGLITAAGKTPPSTSWSGGRGGASGVGRIHIDYSKSYTGTTNPTINATLDTTIKAGGPNFFAFF